MSMQKLLNSVGILDASQQQQVSAELAAQRRANTMLKNRNAQLTAALLSIIDYEQQANPNRNRAQLMQWSKPYAIAMAGIGFSSGRAEAANAISLAEGKTGNDPKEQTGKHASAALQAIQHRRSPTHTDKRHRRHINA
ncbi:MAG: hypothetical protein R3F02_18525 [Thiolinea sp.]